MVERNVQQKLYTIRESARELKITRQAAYQRRGSRNLPFRLTEDDLQILKDPIKTRRVSSRKAKAQSFDNKILRVLKKDPLLADKNLAENFKTTSSKIIGSKRRLRNEGKIKSKGEVLREKISILLKEGPNLTAFQVSENLRLNTAVVQYHIGVLAKKGLIETRLRGRPKKET